MCSSAVPGVWSFLRVTPTHVPPTPHVRQSEDSCFGQLSPVGLFEERSLQQRASCAHRMHASLLLPGVPSTVHADWARHTPRACVRPACPALLSGHRWPCGKKGCRGKSRGLAGAALFNGARYSKERELTRPGRLRVAPPPPQPRHRIHGTSHCTAASIPSHRPPQRTQRRPTRVPLQNLQTSRPILDQRLCQRKSCMYAHSGAAPPACQSGTQTNPPANTKPTKETQRAPL